MTTSSPAEKPPIVVIGAGVSGLTAAAILSSAERNVLVLEAGDGIGGRVRTDRHAEGYLLDRGFQVMLSGYPAQRRHVSIEALNAEAFDAGVRIWSGKRRVPLANPFRHPASLLRDLTSNLFPASDKIRLAKLGGIARLARWQSERDAAGSTYGDLSALEFLQREGFSDRFIERFARPFWSGITLDPTLSGTVGSLRFTMKMFLQGQAMLPAEGMQALPNYLASRLPVGSIRLNTRVSSLIRSNGRVTGIIANGREITASAVVLAADPVASRELSGDTRFPATGLGSITVYLGGTRDPKIGRRLLIDGTGKLAVTAIAALSSVQPTYAPPGKHLIAVMLVGPDAMAMNDDAAIDAAHEESAVMLGQPARDWRPVGISRIPFSRYAQPPGIFSTLPPVQSGTPGLFFAGESVVDSSINGAMLSGEAAAKSLLNRL